MSDRVPSQSGFKSRFSLLSLLPVRHPPLIISHPVPALPTRTVHHARPVLRSSDRVESSYGLTDDPFDEYTSSSSASSVIKKTRGERAYSVNKGKLATPKVLNPRKRPPPLNLARTKAAFPTVKGVELVREDPPSPSRASRSSPKAKVVEGIPKRNESLPVVRGAGDLLKAASKAGRMFKSSAPAPAGSIGTGKKDRPRPKLAAHESYDFVTLEPEHRYPSWKGGKVDIRPGEHIPSNLIPPPIARGKNHRGDTSKPALNRQASSTYSHNGDDEEDQYESVLHNVLLTPTYLAPSTAHRSTTDLIGRSDGKRRTLMDRAKDVLKSVPLPTQTNFARARGPEEKEMTRFPPLKVARQDTITRPSGNVRGSTEKRRERTISTGSSSSISTPTPAIRGVQSTPYKRSPVWNNPRDREESVGFEGSRSSTKVEEGGGRRPLVGLNVSWRAEDGKRSVSVSEAWREKKKKEQAIKRKRLMWRCGLALVFIVLASIAIGVLVSQLTGRKSASDSTESNSTTTSSSMSDETPTSTVPTLPAPTASNAPQNLKTCIEQFSQSSSNPTSYPCSECVPLLASTVNDFETPLIGGNSTNVGGALQFCALMDIYREAPELQEQGWTGEGGVCGWQGIICDERGRVTQLILEYPNVPTTLSDTLGNIVSLSSIKFLGNHSIPNGKLPERLFQLQNLTELDLEYTALTGPFPSNFNGMPKLKTTTLVNNQQLGNGIPDLSSNGELNTLVITGQDLKDINFDTLPTSLTYLDMSFNNLEGTVPSLIQLTSLGTLYMTNNNFTTPPNSLPTSLQTLSLTSNPALKGSMPSTTCSQTNLRQCDLRNTDLGGSGMTVTSANSTSAISAVGGSAGRVCGPCRFT